MREHYIEVLIHKEYTLFMVIEFDTWISEVDEALIGLIGLSSEDLEDQNYYDMFEDGYEPITAAREVLNNLVGDGF